MTSGLAEEFGSERVLDTPISEEGFVGAAIGAAWMGERPVVELQFADFVTCPFDVIVTVAAKTHWRSGQAIPIVIRMPSGGGVRGGPFHSGSPEGLFVGQPGLKVVCPATVEDAYGLTRSAIDDPDPVLVFEHKALYRRARGPRPPPGHRTPLCSAAVVRPGSDATIVTYGSGVAVALEAVERAAADVEVVDLRTVWPLDTETVLSSVRRTSRVLVAAGGCPLDGRRRPAPLARRARGVRGPRRAACAPRAARHARPLRARARGRVPAIRRLRRRPRSMSSSPTEPAAPCADLASVGRADRLALHRLVLLQRTFEERALALYRQGRIAGSFYDGRGQEAVAAAAGLALGPDDVVCPLNRELATHLARGVTVAEVFRNFLGRGDSPTRGRDGNMHFGCPARGVFPLVSMLGDLVPVTVGAALAFKRRGEARVALTFLGEGAFSVGDTHEGLNLAGVWQVPAVFVLQRNQWSYSTPLERQMVNPRLAERLTGGWSIPCETVDGTDGVVVLDAVRAAVERARAGSRPAGGGGGDAAAPRARRPRRRPLRPAGAARRVRGRDPVERLEARLELDGEPPDALAATREDVAREIAAGLAEAERSPAPDPGDARGRGLGGPTRVTARLRSPARAGRRPRARARATSRARHAGAGTSGRRR